jgi:hypothetical protein
VRCDLSVSARCWGRLLRGLERARSTYRRTFLPSDSSCIMFPSEYSHQWSPRSSALAKPFRPAHGPPFRLLYSSSSTAKFQSCSAIWSEHSRVSLPGTRLAGRSIQQRSSISVQTKGRRIGYYSRSKWKHNHSMSAL